MPPARLFWTVIVLACAIVFLALPTPTAHSQSLDAQPRRPLVIAHRGASGTFPEHTLQAYAAAIDMGADFIEPDLVMTRDGVLIARHDRYLSTTTNIADIAAFADRRRTKIVGGQPREDWFVEDFTLAEIKTLRARQPFGGRDKSFDDQFAIPTFVEILSLVAITNTSGQRLGVYPELKSPRVFEAEGHDVRGALLGAIDAADLAGLGAPVFIQCFDPDTLRQLNDATQWPLVQLLPTSTGERLAPADIALYADGVGPWKRVIERYREGPRAYIEAAHSAGLVVHAYTYRADNVPPEYADFQTEVRQAFSLGLDGLFTDHPAEALAVRDGS